MSRRIAGLVLPATVAMAVGVAAVAALRAAGPSTPYAAAQTEPGLTESYALESTWDGDVGQGSPGSLLLPAGIEITDAAVFVVDRGNDRVQLFTHDGTFLSTFGQRGSGPGDLRDPRGIAVDGATVYVADTGNGRIALFDVGGRAIDSLSVDGLPAPWGVAARAGRLVVTDAEHKAAAVLQSGAVVVRLAGVQQPMGADVGPDGRIYVADVARSAVLVFAADGAPVATLATNLPPVDVAVDPTGDLYVQSAGAVLWYPAGSVASRQAMYYTGMQGVAVHVRAGVMATVARMDVRKAPCFHGVVRYPWRPSEGLPQAEWRLRGFPPGRLSHPSAVHVGPSGRVWVLDEWPRLQSFQPNGRPDAPLIPETNVGVIPVDIAESPSGELLVGESRRLLRVTADGAIVQQRRLAAGSAESWLTALEWTSDLPGVRVLDSAFAVARDYGVTRTIAGGAAWPLAPQAGWQLFWDMASEPSEIGGQEYAVNRSAGEVWVYRNRQKVAAWPVDGTPIRLAVDAEGHVFVLTSNGLVHKMTRLGQVVAMWDAGAFSAGSSEVVDVAVDPQGRVYTVDRAANVVRVWRRDTATPEPPASQPGACRLRADKTAVPSALRIGDPVTVRLEIGGECPTAKPRADIVLAIDTSGSMNANNQITDTRQAAITFLGAIDTVRDRVAVVSFNTSAQIVQPLTSDRALAAAAIQRLTAIGGTNIAEAFQLSTAELTGPNARADAQPVIVLLTDGQDREADVVLDAAGAARQLGAKVFTIGFGDVDPMVMVLSASTPEDYYYAPDTSRLAAIYTEIAQRIIASVLARSLTVRDQLPANMAYVPGSAQPPATYEPASRTLTWVLSDVPFTGAALLFRVIPGELGRHPTNLTAEGEFVDGLGSTGRLRFPVPQVEVLSLQPTATPTSTPLPTPTPLPTRTPLPPEPLFLPVAVKQRCADVNVYADVVVAMDTSSSMEGLVGQGDATKLEMAKAAARIFVSLLHMPGDQAAVVRFDQDARIEQLLTSDAAAVMTALDRLETGQGTRIDKGIQLAAEELASPRHHEGSSRAIVLLTDGRNTGVEDAVVVQRAAEAKAAGILLYTIGLGDDVDAAMLAEIATGPGFFFLAPTAAELEDIYREIAYTIFCPNLTWP